MLNLTEAKIWMRNALNYEFNEYDYYGEVNHTKLTENCANALNLYDEDGETIPEELFDLAIDVAEQRAV